MGDQPAGQAPEGGFNSRNERFARVGAGGGERGATGGAGPQEQRGGAGEGMAYGLLCPGQAARQEELRHRGWAVGGRAQRVRGG